MHAEAYDFVARVCAEQFPSALRRGRLLVVEFGSLNINGSVRGLFAPARYHGIDVQPGPDVDELADAVTWRSPTAVDVVVCCEVLEHTPQLEGVVASAAANLRSGGWFIVTCATEPRAPHSAVDGGALVPGEYYGNVDASRLLRAFWTSGFTLERIEANRERGDLYALARQPHELRAS